MENMFFNYIKNFLETIKSLIVILSHFQIFFSDGY